MLCNACFKEIDGYSCPYCGYDGTNYASDPLALELGTVLAQRYQIGRMIKAGGFGITYICYDLREGVRRAIKEYLPTSLATRNRDGYSVASYGSNERLFRDGCESFYREAKTVYRFNGNPNIVSLYEFFNANNTAYFVMEYLEGTDLSDYVAMNNGHLKAGIVLYIAQKIAEALSVIHSADILHRDISPSNIIICPGGEVKLIDFGAARQYVAEQSKSLTVVMKEGFTPPEQYKKEPQGCETDLYALGASMYYMFKGTPPMNSIERPRGDHIIIPEHETGSAELSQIIRKLLELDPKNRYHRASDLRDDLSKVRVKPRIPNPYKVDDEKDEIIAGTTGIISRRVSKYEPAASRKDSVVRTVLMGGAAALILIGGITTGVLIANNSNSNSPSWPDNDNVQDIPVNQGGTSTETEPQETKPQETTPAETKPKETNPPETTPAETEPKETDPPETEPPKLEVESVGIDRSKCTIAEGDTVTLKATVLPEKAADKKLTWTSSDNSVATVDANGKVTAKKAGSATITVKSSNGKTAKCTVTVEHTVVWPTGVKLNASTYELSLGYTLTLKATVSPSDADDKTVTWTSSNPSVVAVDETGKVSPKSIGEATITATTVNGKTASCKITVPGIKAVKPDKTSVTLSKGGSHTFKVTLDKVGNPDTAVTLKSSNTSVATVSGNTVTAAAPGTATITFTAAGGATATADVTVTGIRSIKTESSVTLSKGGTYTFNVIVDKVGNPDTTVTLTSSNTSVATVNGKTVTAVAPGTATITFTAADGVKTTATVIVAESKVTAIKTDSSVTLSKGGAHTFKITLEKVGNPDTTVTLISSDTSIATVSGNTVYAVAPGTATITFTAVGGARTTSFVTVAGIKSISTDTSVVLTQGESHTFQYVFDKVGNPDTTVTLTSSNPSVASVKGNTVTASAPGTATITFKTADNITTTCNVTVNPAHSIGEGNSYEGETRNGVPHGNGTMTYENGDVYTGSFVDGKRDGYGEMKYASQTDNKYENERKLYKGYWKDNLQHGEGELTWEDGSKYVGSFQKNMRHGQGTYTEPDGYKYVGAFANDMQNGKGKSVWANGQIYEGEFKDGQRHGKGKYSWPDGDVYEGEWQNNQQHGEGKYTWDNGDFYDGEWKNGNRDGYGKMTIKNQYRYEGYWKDDMKHGEGTLTYSDGRTLRGQWAYDYFID